MNQDRINPYNGLATSNVPCVACGYNLRGLPASSRCPECGQMVNHSLDPELLRFAPVDWLRKIKLGVDAMVYSIVFGVFLPYLLVIAFFGVGQSVFMAADFLLLLGGVAFLIANMLVTTPEPHVRLNERPLSWRRFVRVCAIASLVGMLLMRVVPLDELIGAVPAVILGVLLSFAVIGWTFGYFAFLATFTPRMPNAKLGRLTHIVKWGMTIPYTIATVEHVSMPAFSPSSAGDSVGAITILLGPGPASYLLNAMGLMIFIAILLALLIVRRYGRAFKAAIRESAALRMTSEE